MRGDKVNILSFFFSTRTYVVGTHNRCFHGKIKISILFCLIQSYDYIGLDKNVYHIKYFSYFSTKTYCEYSLEVPSRKHTYIILTPLNPTFIQ